MPATQQRRTSRIAGAAIAVAIGLVLGVVASEAMLRVVAPLPDHFFLYKPKMRVLFQIPDGELPGVTGPSHFVMNSQGVRADELTPDVDFRVLAIGGSTTIDAYLDYPKTWTQQLQRRLNEAQHVHRVWVGNAGKSAHRTREHRLQAEHLLDDLAPVDVVVLLIGANDMLRRLSEDQSYDPHFCERPDAEEQIAYRAFDYVPLRFQRSQPAWKRTELYARAHQVYLLGRRLWLGYARGALEDVKGVNLQTWRANRRDAIAIRDALPDLGPALDEYAANIEHIAATVRAHGAEPVFATQPSIWRADLPASLEPLLWLGGVGDFQRAGARSEYYSVAALADAMDQYNQRLLAVCRQIAVRCVDLAARIPKDESAFYDDAHFNEAGARIVAATFAEEILPLVEAKGR